MLALILGTVILALAYGALWHNQPARRQNDERGDEDFRFGRLVNHALEWLLLMPHVSNPAENKEPARISEKSAIPKRQTAFFRPVLHALRRWNHWRRLLIGRAAVTPPACADLFKSRVDTNALAGGRTT
jgi:hypothetical protein